MILKKDITSNERKKDHIDLAFKSETNCQQIDQRFLYEPLLSGHPRSDKTFPVELAAKALDFPLWVSSMTGGTEFAQTINRNLAKACKEFKLGMGLGSCRSILDSDDRLQDFDIRKHIGDQPLYANLGIAQLIDIAKEGSWNKVKNLVTKLSADGLIVHINPLQEWMQPEGDRYHMSPIECIQQLLDKTDINVMVKEVGQGMGKTSLKALLELPLVAVDFAAHGGTNFSKLELFRGSEQRKDTFLPVTRIGHSAATMLEWANELKDEINCHCNTIIVSGGVKNFLDGYYFTQKSKFNNTIYGQASGFLKHAMGDYEDLQKHVRLQIEGLQMSHAFLTLNPEHE
jgi:isopentenyl-diphosphate delta-isomerase